MEALMEMVMREDTFDGVPIHTFSWRSRPAWLEAEIQRALGYAARNTEDTPDALHGADFEILEGHDARLLLDRCELPGSDEMTSAVVLYAPGLALACASVHGAGINLRRVLVEAAEGVREAVSLGELERRVDAMLQVAEVNLRRHKAAALLRIIEAAQTTGTLENAILATSMACVAEIALGQRVRLPVHAVPVEEPVLRADDLADLLGAPRAWTAAAIDSLRTRTAGAPHR